MNLYQFNITLDELNQTKKEKLITKIITNKYIRGDYKYLETDKMMPVKSLEEAIDNLRLREEIEQDRVINCEVAY
jgi:hypothetical protein